MEKSIKVEFDYYGNVKLGKRVFYVKDTQIPMFIWEKDFISFANKQKALGYEINIINKHEVSLDILNAIK